MQRQIEEGVVNSRMAVQRIEEGVVNSRMAVQQQIEEGVVNSRMAVAKATSLSSRHHKEITLNLAKRSTEVTTCISKLIEQAEEMFSNVSQQEEWATRH